MDKESKVNNIHAKHRERMRKTFLDHGLDAFSDIEKIEFLLFYAIPFKDTNPIAHRLIDEYKDFNGIVNAPIEGLMNIDGVGKHVAIFLKTLLSFIGEYHKGANKNKPKLLGCASSKEYCKNLFVGKQNEELVVFCLNNECEIINTKHFTKGSTSQINIQSKDIIFFVLNNNCERIIVTHNHPSGLAMPSDEDISFTSNLILNCLMNGITLVDHIIVSPKNQYSMYESEQIEILTKHQISLHNIKPPIPNAKWTPYKKGI